MSKLINGELKDLKVTQKVYSSLHKGKISPVNAIVVHQTGASTEAVNAKQNASLKWLVTELSQHLSLQIGDVYRHPAISYKQPSEAATASW